MKSATVTKPVVDGLKLMEAVNFDHRLAASIIATRDDWEEILATIPVSHQRANVGHVCREIRSSLGMSVD